MTTLEKILQDIEEHEDNYNKKGTLKLCPLWVKEIIKNNLLESDDWILCAYRLPNANEKVEITFREFMPYSKKYRYGTCFAVYIPKHSIKAEDVFSDYEVDDCVDYDEETDIVYVKDGWYELIEHWDDYSHCYINCDVVAWRDATKQYKESE